MFVDFIYDFLDGVTIVYCPECDALIFLDSSQFDGNEPTECDVCGLYVILKWDDA